MVEPQPSAIFSTRLIKLIDLDARAVEFDDQKRLDVERIAGMNERLGGVDRGLVHHLHAARNDSGADDVGDAFAGGLDLRESRPSAPARFPASAGSAP